MNFNLLPDDIHAVIFLSIKNSLDILYQTGYSLGYVLKYFRICKRTYNIREFILVYYNLNNGNGLSYIPPAKNAYPYLLMHYFEHKLTRKGRYGYRHFIMEFLCNKKRDSVMVNYKDQFHYRMIIDFCESQGLIVVKNNIYERHGYSVLIHKPSQRYVQ